MGGKREHFGLGSRWRQRMADLEVAAVLMRFYDYCAKYIEEVREGDKAFVQTFKFVQSQIWLDMLTRVGRRAGIELDNKKANLIWDICRYERAWGPTKNSPWCPL